MSPYDSIPKDPFITFKLWVCRDQKTHRARVGANGPVAEAEDPERALALARRRYYWDRKLRQFQAWEPPTQMEATWKRYEMERLQSNLTITAPTI